MNAGNLRTLVVGLAVLSTAPLQAQTTVWVDTGGDSLWETPQNWSNGVPTSGSDVQVGTQPSNNTIEINTGGLATITSLEFNNTLTAPVTISPSGTENLRVNGGISNLDTHAGDVEIVSIPVIAGANATYAGGVGIDFGVLTVGTSTITTTGTVTVESAGKLVFTINSSSVFGSLVGSVNVSGVTINIGGTYTGTIGNTFQLTNTNFSGATLGTLPTLSAGLQWNTTQFLSNGILSVGAPAAQTLTNPNPLTLNIIAGASGSITATLSNTAASGGNPLAVGLAGTGGTTGSLTNLTAASGSTVAANSSTTVTGTYTAGAGAAGTSGTYTISNTDPNATGTFVSTTGTVNVFSHANGQLGVTGSTTLSAIAGTTITSTLTYVNSGSTNVSTTVTGSSTGITGITGTFTANQSAVGSGTFTVGAAGTTGTHTYSIDSQEDQTVVGATTGTSVASATVTVTSYNHANGQLAVTGSTTLGAIAGTVITSTVTFTNSGANNDNLTAGASGGGLTAATGTFTANQSTTLTGTFTVGAAGATTTHNYTQGWTEDQSVIGATTGTQTSTATVTVTSYTHANGVLTTATGSTVRIIAGATSTVPIEFINSGTTNDSLIAGSSSANLTTATGSITGGNMETLTGTLVTGAAGTTMVNTYSQNWTEDQSILGATAGTQTSTLTVSAEAFSHANGVLTITTGTTVNVIAGTTVTSTLTFANTGTTNDNLIAGTATGGLTAATGSLTANQAQTLTGTFVAGAAGTTGTNTYAQNWTEDQTVIGATAGTQTSTATVTYDSFSHANGVLTVTGSTTIGAIAGTAITSTLTFANSGTTNDNLTAGASGGGLTAATGSFTANQSTTLTGTFTVGAAGATTTHDYTQNFTEDQTVLGATTGTQVATATVTVTSYTHASGTLTVTSGTSVLAIGGTTVTSTLTFTNGGATNDDLIAGTSSANLTGATGSLTANQSQTLTGTTVAGAAGTTTSGTFTQNWTEDQTILGATTGTQSSTATVTITNLNHSMPTLSGTMVNVGTVHVGAAASLTGTTVLSNPGANNAELQIVSVGSLTSSITGTLIPANGTDTLTATIGTGTVGAVSNVYTIQTEDATNVIGGTANANLTFTVTGEVYSGQSVWSTNGNGSWGTVTGTGTSAFGLNWGANQGSPGLDPNFNDTDTATFNNSTLTAGSTATVTLDGANPSLKAITFNTTGGGYTLNQGTSGSISLNGGANAATITDAGGSHTINAPLVFNTNVVASVTNAGDLLTLSGAISGTTISTTISGTTTSSSTGLMIAGSGTVGLTGTVSYTGSTILASGTLKLGAANELLSSTAIAVNGGVLDVNGFNQTFNNLSGTGGTITNNSVTTTTITFTEPADPVNSSNITGNTAVVQNGPGLLGLDGTNSYTGGTTINSGTLEVGSTTALGTGPVTNSGGTLGTFNGVHVINIGVVGTPADTANYTQAAGGTLYLNLTATPDAVTGLNAANDLLQVTGTAALNGGLTLNFVVTPSFIPTKGEQFTLVESNLNNVGALNGITALGAGFATPVTTPVNAGIKVTTADSIDGNNVVATITAVGLTLAQEPGLSPNETSIARYISANVTGGTLFNTFAGVTGSPQTVAHLLDEVSPEKFALFTHSTAFNNEVFSTQILDNYLEGQRTDSGEFRASNGKVDSSGLSLLDSSMDPGLAGVGGRLLAWNPAPLEHGMMNDSASPFLGGVDTKAMAPNMAPEIHDPFSVFVAGNAVLAQNFSQTDLAHSDVTTGAVQIGGDYRITPHLRAGVSFGYSHSDADLDNIGSKATVDSYAPGVYVSYANKGWYATGTAHYGFDSFTEDRHFSPPGLGIAHGAPSGDQITGNVDGGYDFHMAKLTYGPTLGVEYTHLSVDGYNESGSAANLQVQRDETDSLRTRLGAHASYPFTFQNILLTPHLNASWQHEFLDQADGITAAINGAGGAFSVNSPRTSRDSALLNGGIDADITGTVSLFGDYSVQVGQDNYFGQSVEAGVKIGF